jgi:hypothetical protein
MPRRLGGDAGVAILGSNASMLVGLRAGWIVVAGAGVCAGARLLVFGGRSVGNPSTTRSPAPHPAGHLPHDLQLKSEPIR